MRGDLYISSAFLYLECVELQQNSTTKRRFVNLTDGTIVFDSPTNVEFILGSVCTTDARPLFQALKKGLEENDERTA